MIILIIDTLVQLMIQESFRILVPVIVIVPRHVSWQVWRIRMVELSSTIRNLTLRIQIHVRLINVQVLQLLLNINLLIEFLIILIALRFNYLFMRTLRIFNYLLCTLLLQD